MPELRSWSEMRQWQIGLLQRSTGENLEDWTNRIRDLHPTDETQLRSWLDGRGVRGYAQLLLVHETFGYPDFFTKSADELIDAQYADRSSLRPILDAILLQAAEAGDLVIQARKTYVSLVGPRRTFAVVRATTRSRVDLGLRLGVTGDRLLPAKGLGNDTITARVPLAAPDEVDDEVSTLLAQAYAENL